MKAVIMAGGLGTRIAEVDRSVPKPMMRLQGTPVLEHQINVLKRQGITDIVLTIGYLGSVIQSYFENGEKFDVNIQYIFEERPLGTAGGLRFLRDSLQKDEDFLLINGDIILDIDFMRLVEFHKKQSVMATILIHPNDHPFDSAIVVADDSRYVKKWYHKEEEKGWYQNRVNAGVHVINSKVLELPIFSEKEKIDLDRDILKPLINLNELSAYYSTEYVKDMGTPERMLQVENDLKSGKIERRNMQKKQKAIFLDRDGTINKYMGFLREEEQFELLPDVTKAIKRINQSDYLCVVVTNQPVIARGDVSEEQLKSIHNKMETLLGEEGAFIDALYYCPHHPDKGFEGERIELKIRCECRKPKPGMLLFAANDLNIDLTESWMVGDSENDIIAGRTAGCKTGLINQNNSYDADVVDTSLYNIIERIL